MEPDYSFGGVLFAASAEASWVFVALPADTADDISERVPHRPGFGSVRVVARIGSTQWRTSVFPSKEYRTYVLPVKRSVRDDEQVDAGDTVRVTIQIIDG